MSDQFGPDGDEDFGATPPPPPTPPQSPIEPVLTLDSEAEVSSSSSGIGGRAVAGLLGALLLVGGTIFAVTQIGSSGPGSAEDAVADLLEAAGNEDILGMMAALDPGERDALRGPVEDIFGELERLEVLDDSFDLGGVQGIDFEFADVTYRAEPVRDGLTRVYLTGGTVTSSVDSDELPIGDFIVDTVERFDGDVSGFRESETSDIYEDGNDEVFLVAREGDDGWRVSIGYTIAEAARLDAGQPLLASGIEPVGADSPEAAVEGMIGALTDLDLRDAIARLSPNEFAALHDYADLFLPEAEAEIDSVRDEFEVTIDDISLRSDTSGDRATVFMDSIAVSVEADGKKFSLKIDEDCFTVDGDLQELDLEGSPFEDGPVCSEDLEALSNEMFGGFDFGGPQDDPIEFPEIETPEIGITTHRVDGEWYVAPVATSLDAMVSGLGVLERSHLDALVDIVEQFFFGFGSAFDESIGAIPDSIEGFEEFEEFEEFGELDELPSPIPSIDVGGQGGIIDEAALQEFLFAYSGDQATVACLRAELRQVDPFLVAELADSYTYDYEPSPEAQDVFFAAAKACS